MRLPLLLALPAAVASTVLCAQGPDRWELLGQGYQLTADSAVDKDGIVYFTDARTNRILKVDLDGKISTWKEGSNGTHGVAFGPDGRLYGGQHERKRIVAFSDKGKESVITEGVQSHHLTVTSRNEIYFSEAPAHKVWMADTAGHARVVYDGMNWPHGVRAFGDRLFVNDSGTRLVWAFQIQADGSLVSAGAFCELQSRDGEVDPGGMSFDSNGFLYVATRIGVQVCDPQGHVTATIEGPSGKGVSNVFFGGRGLQWLYVTDLENIYRRPMTIQ